MKKPRNLLRRTFLNDREWNPGMAAIRALVKTETMRVERGARAGEVTRSMDADLTITDCSSSVQLDFSVWSSERDHDAAANARYKAAVLRDIVNEFADRVNEATAWVEEDA